MFVKGGTVGATLDDVPTPAPAPTPVASAGAGGAAAGGAAAAAASETFNWKAAIKRQLRAAPDGQMRVKQLRRAVLAEHTSVPGGAEGSSGGESLRKVFRKRLKKADYLTLQGKTVRLKRG